MSAPKWTPKRGDRVTAEPREHWDGKPVFGWPNKDYFGTVIGVEDLAGCLKARIKFDSGRTAWEHVDEIVPLPFQTFATDLARISRKAAGNG